MTYEKDLQGDFGRVATELADVAVDPLHGKAFYFREVFRMHEKFQDKQLIKLTVTDTSIGRAISKNLFTSKETEAVETVVGRNENDRGSFRD